MDPDLYRHGRLSYTYLEPGIERGSPVGDDETMNVPEMVYGDSTNL